MAGEAINVAVTGGAGQIAYSLIPRILNGEAFGADRPVDLRLLEIEPALGKLTGVAMEAYDLGSPLLEGEITQTSDPDEAFEDADFVFAIGSMPRKEGMDRNELLAINAGIFKEQGKSISSNASNDVRALVVGNPANTNAAILSSYAKNIDSSRVTAMTRLDHNRAVGSLASILSVSTKDISGLWIGGNHSNTMVPVLENASVNGQPILEALGEDFDYDEFKDGVATRGGAVIKARGLSSAMSAASAAIDHAHDWMLGSDGRVVSMGVLMNNGGASLEHEDLQGQDNHVYGTAFSRAVTTTEGGNFEVSVDHSTGLAPSTIDLLKASADELGKEHRIALPIN